MKMFPISEISSTTYLYVVSYPKIQVEVSLHLERHVVSVSQLEQSAEVVKQPNSSMVKENGSTKE